MTVRRKTAPFPPAFLSASSSLFGPWTGGRAASSKGQQEASYPSRRSPVGKCCTLQNPAGAGDANAMRALLALTASCQTCLHCSKTSHVAAVRDWPCCCFNEARPHSAVLQPACLDDGKKVGPGPRWVREQSGQRQRQRCFR